MTAMWRCRVGLDNRAGRRVWSEPMRWGLQSRGRVLRGILPLLALVWATATWHDCYLEGMNGGVPPVAAEGHCAHQNLVDVAMEFALDLPAPDAVPDCDDIADVGPDLRPAPHEMLTSRSFDFVPAPMDADPRGVGLLAARTATVPPDRPLQQRPARLLV